METGQSALSVAQKIIGCLFNPYLEAFDFHSKSCPNGDQLKDAFQIELNGIHLIVISCNLAILEYLHTLNFKILRLYCYVVIRSFSTISQSLRNR